MSQQETADVENYLLISDVSHVGEKLFECHLEHEKKSDNGQVQFIESNLLALK